MRIFFVPSKVACLRYPDKVDLLEQVLGKGAFKGDGHAVIRAGTSTSENEAEVASSHVVVFALTSKTVFKRAGNPARGVRSVSKLVVGRGVHDINDSIPRLSIARAYVVFVDEESESRAHFNAYQMPEANRFTILSKELHESDLEKQRSPIPSWTHFSWADWNPFQVELDVVLGWPPPIYGDTKTELLATPQAKIRLAVACSYLKRTC